MNNFAVRLKKARGTRTQADIAKLLGIKQQAYARYEKGDVLPGAEVLHKICLLFPVSADWLLGLREGMGDGVCLEGSALSVGGDAVNRVGVDCRGCELVARLTGVIEALSGGKGKV